MDFELTSNRQKKGRGDVLFAATVVTIIGLLIVPMPPFVLDIFLVANISVGVVLLLTSLYITEPMKLSTFPSLLLVTTLFRLALNVSSTRLILGDGYAGEVVRAFGEFVVRGNYLVGGVVFLVLTVVQFLVVAKGSERVAEVAARFTLDAMPGRQMSIDADLRAGAYSLSEAREKREALQRESKFFGAMDGAMKFVKGDALAGMVITVINICGGLLIGVVQHDLGFGEAAGQYSLLTIGDGLVSQVPALLISVCSGILVTRVGGGERAKDQLDLGNEIAQQLGRNPKVYAISCGLLMVFASIPGLPAIPFLLLAIASAGYAWSIRSRLQLQARQRLEAEALDTSSEDRGPAMIPVVAPITVDLGDILSRSLLEEGGERKLREQVQQARRAFFVAHGVRLPQLKLRFSSSLVSESEVLIRIFEAHKHGCQLDLESRVLLAACSDLVDVGVETTPWAHPLNGKEYCSVPIERAATISAAYDIRVMTRAEQVLVEVMAISRSYASSFVGLAAVQRSLDQLEASHGALIEAVVPTRITLAELTGVIRRLVEEGVSVRDLRGILEALAEDATGEEGRVELLEIARCGIARTIWASYQRQGRVEGYIVSRVIEEVIRSGIECEHGRQRLSLPPDMVEEVFEAFEGVLIGSPAIILCAQDMRRVLRQFLATRYPGVVVLGHGEMVDGISFHPLGSIEPGRNVPAEGLVMEGEMGSAAE